MTYHALARTTGHRWWKPVVGTVLIAVAATGLAFFGYLLVMAGTVLTGRSLGPLAEFALSFLIVATLLPATLLAARWIQGRPAGTLSSVTGRLRLRWLLTCLPVALVAIVVSLGGGLALGVATDLDLDLGDGLTGPGTFAVSMLVLLLVVPPQVAAEEYLTRGWLLQAVGVWFRRPWVPIAVQALAFAALHGWGTAWGFADLWVFGAVAGWLTVRTGGLEAAIALHLMNNLVSAALTAAYDNLGSDETATDLPWQLAVVDVPVLIAYAAVVLWVFRRRPSAPRRMENAIADLTLTPTPGRQP